LGDTPKPSAGGLLLHFPWRWPSPLMGEDEGEGEK
jgi:hypothetical protein